MTHINPTLPVDGSAGWGDVLNTAVGTIVAQSNSHDDVITSLPSTYALIGSTGGGYTGTLTAVDNGDGTTTLAITGTGYTLVNNGDGTTTVTGPSVTDNGDGTTSVISGSAGNNAHVPVTRSVTGTSYTLIIGDADNIVENGGPGALVITVPTSTSVPYPIGTVIEFFNYVSGSIIIQPASGVQVRSPNGLRLLDRYASAAMRQRATDEWVLAGYTSV